MGPEGPAGAPTTPPLGEGLRSAAVELAVVLVGLVLLGWATGVLVVHVFAAPVRHRLDVPVNRWFFHHRTAGTARVMALVTRAGSERGALAGAVVIGGMWSWLTRRLGPARALAAAYGGAAVIAYAVKVAVGRGRHRNVGLFASAAHLGYPSGHATLAAAVYGTAGLLLARRVRTPTRRAAAAACFALAVVVGFSRLYLGRHYLSDVIAGTALGGLWAVALTRTNPRRRGNRRAATSGPER